MVSEDERELTNSSQLRTKQWHATKMKGELFKNDFSFIAPTIGYR